MDFIVFVSSGLVVLNRSKYVWLVNFDTVAIRVVQKNLIPAGYSPTPVVGVTNSKGVAPTHKPFDVIRAETKMTVAHWVHELFHFESCFQISLCPMEFNVAIGQKIYFPGIRTIISVRTNDGMCGVIDRSEFKQCFVELGQPRQVVAANIHVMKLEFHGAFFPLS
jgi:hypothetical protein